MGQLTKCVTCGRTRRSEQISQELSTQSQHLKLQINHIKDLHFTVFSFAAVATANVRRPVGALITITCLCPLFFIYILTLLTVYFDTNTLNTDDENVIENI